MKDEKMTVHEVRRIVKEEIASAFMIPRGSRMVALAAALSHAASQSVLSPADARAWLETK